MEEKRLVEGDWGRSEDKTGFVLNIE